MELYLFLRWGLDGTEWSSRPSHFKPKTEPGTDWIGDWMIKKPSMEGLEKERIPFRCQDWNPRSSSPYPNLNIDWAKPAPSLSR